MFRKPYDLPLQGEGFLDNCFKTIKYKFHNAWDHACYPLEIRDSLRILVDHIVATNCFSDELLKGYRQEASLLQQENPQYLSRLATIIEDRLGAVEKDRTKNGVIKQRNRDKPDDLAVIRHILSRIGHDEVVARYTRLKDVVDGMLTPIPSTGNVIPIFSPCDRGYG